MPCWAAMALFVCRVEASNGTCFTLAMRPMVKALLGPVVSSLSLQSLKNCLNRVVSAPAGSTWICKGYRNFSFVELRCLSQMWHVSSTSAFPQFKITSRCFLSSFTCVLLEYPLSLMNCWPAAMAALRSEVFALGPGRSEMRMRTQWEEEFLQICENLRALNLISHFEFVTQKRVISLFC